MIAIRPCKTFVAPTDQAEIHWREIAGVALLAAMVTGGVMWPLLGVLSTHLPASNGDPALNAWILAWGVDRLAHGLQGVWSPPIYYPYSNTLAYSENLLGIAAVVAPVQWLLKNPILTYNVAFLLSFVVSAVSAYVLAREHTGSRGAALIAGFAFAFAPYRWAQLTHLQVLWTAWLPLALWALHRAIRTRRGSLLGVFGLAILLQVCSSGYSAFQSALAVPLVAGWSVARYAVSTAWLRRSALAGLLAGLLLAPMIATYYQIWAAREPTPGDLVTNGADLADYLDVHPDLPDVAWLPGTAHDEGHLFPGAVVVALALLAFAPLGRWRPGPSGRWLYGLIGLMALVLSLGPEPTAWRHRLPIPPIYAWLVSVVPMFDAMRVPARFGMLVVLAASVLAALGFARVMFRVAGAYRAGLVAGLTLLIVWEGYGGPLAVIPGAPTGGDGDAAAFEWLAVQPPGPVLNLPLGTLGEGGVMYHQYQALKSGRPMVDGVSRISSPLEEWISGSASPLAVPELLPQAVPFLRAVGIRYVLMRPADFLDHAIASRVSDAFAQDTTMVNRGQFGGVTAWEITPGRPGQEQEPGLKKLPPERFQLSASHRPDRLQAMTDGNPETRWLTNDQTGSEWIAIAFDRPIDLARIDFTMHPVSLRDYPRRLEVVSEASVSGAPAKTLYHGDVLEQLGRGWREAPERPVISMTLPANRTSRVQIYQRGQVPHWSWSIHELVLWERDRSGTPAGSPTGR